MSLFRFQVTAADSLPDFRANLAVVLADADWLTVRPGTKADAIAEALIASTDAAAESLLRSRGPLRIPGERFAVREG